MADQEKPIPREITRANEHDVRIVWKDEHQSIYPAGFLRWQCPCAGCVDEWSGQRVLREEDVPGNVGAVSVELVGRYACRVRWSDGHSDGIYTFESLRKLCPCRECQEGRAGKH